MTENPQQPREPNPTKPLAWGSEQSLSLVPGGKNFATTTWQPVSIESIERDRKGRAFHLISQIIRGVRVSGYTEAIRYGVGQEVIDGYVYPSDGPEVPGQMPINEARTATELSALLDQGFRYFTYRGLGTKCLERTLEKRRVLDLPYRRDGVTYQPIWDLIQDGTHLTFLGPALTRSDGKGISAFGGGQRFVVLEIRERDVLVGRTYDRQEMPVGYRRTGVTHWWRSVKDCEAERAADLHWAKELPNKLIESSQ